MRKQKQIWQERKRAAKMLACVLSLIGVFWFGLWVKERANIALAHDANQQQIAALFKAPVAVAPIPKLEQATYEEPEQEDSSKRVYIRQQKCLAHMVDGEAGDQTFEGKLQAAHVGFGRALDNTVEWGGSDVCNVVCKHTPGRWQFDGAKVACMRKMQGEPSAESMDAAYKVMTGEYKPQGCLARARYFMNPDISGDHGALWMLRESKYCASVDGHAFFEPRHRKLYAKLHQQHAPKKTLVQVAYTISSKPHKTR